MSLNGKKSSAADLRWRRQRHTLERDRARKKAYAHRVVLKVAEDLEAEFVRLVAPDNLRVGVDVGGPDRTVLAVGRQLGKDLYIEALRTLQQNTRFVYREPDLNEAALAEIERILDDYEAAVAGDTKDTGTPGVESIRSDLREFFGVRGGVAGGTKQKHR